MIFIFLDSVIRSYVDPYVLFGDMGEGGGEITGRSSMLMITESESDEHASSEARVVTDSIF